MVRPVLCRRCLPWLNVACFSWICFVPFRSDLLLAFARVHIPLAVDVGFGKDLPDSVDDFRMAFCQIILARKVLVMSYSFIGLEGDPGMPTTDPGEHFEHAVTWFHFPNRDIDVSLVHSVCRAVSGRS